MSSWYTAGRIDGFGDRLLMFDNSGAASLELLRFRPDLAAEPGFEDLLRQRVQRLSTFRHPSFATIRTVEHLEGGAGLALVSNHTAGRRLGELLDSGRPGGLHPAFVSWLVQHITPLLAALQGHGYDIVHGALTADRIVLTPEGRVAIIEHALGSALRGLEWSPARLWREFGIVARPTSRGEACLDARGDILQLGVVALSLLLGRRITLQDAQEQLPARLDEFSGLPSARASLFTAPLRQWLERALQTHPQSYRSAAEAQEGLRELPAQTATSTPALLNSMMPAGGDFASPIEPPLAPPVIAAHAAPEQKVAAAALEAEYSSEPVASASTLPGADASPAPSSPVKTGTAPILDLSPLLPPEAADIERTEDRSREVASMFETRHEPFALTGQTGRASLVRPMRRGLVAGLALVAVVEAVVIAVMFARRPAVSAAAVAAPLAITVEAAQPGTTVFVNDQVAGTTPLNLAIDDKTRSIRLAGGSGVATTATGVPPAAAPPAGARAAAAAQVAARPRNGSVRFTSPFPLQVLEGAQVLGNTADGSIAVPAGTHQFELVNAELGFRSRQSVTVRTGETASFTVTTPMGRLSVNAQPWAQVLVDQNAVGETPIANLAVPIGQHQVTFKHPQLGERTETVIVRADGVTRLSTTFGR